MILPLMHILIISDNGDEWVKKIKAVTNPNRIQIQKFRYGVWKCEVFTPLFHVYITDNVTSKFRGYRFNTVIYDKYVDDEIRGVLQCYTNDIYSNRAWLSSTNPCGGNAKLNWYRKFVLFFKRRFSKSK